MPDPASHRDGKPSGAGPTPHVAAVSGERQAPPGQKVTCDYVEMTAHVEQKEMHVRRNLTVHGRDFGKFRKVLCSDSPHNTHFSEQAHPHALQARQEFLLSCLKSNHCQVSVYGQPIQKIKSGVSLCLCICSLMMFQL